MMTADVRRLACDPSPGSLTIKRIKVRQRPERCFRNARFGQGERLAGQPFQIAVLAEVDDHVNAEASTQPRVKGEIMMRRNEVGIVVTGHGVDVVAARGLNADNNVAELQQSKFEDVVEDLWIILRSPPAFFDTSLQNIRQSIEKLQIVIDGKRNF